MGPARPVWALTEMAQGHAYHISLFKVTPGLQSSKFKGWRRTRQPLVGEWQSLTARTRRMTDICVAISEKCDLSHTYSPADEATQVLPEVQLEEPTGRSVQWETCGSVLLPPFSITLSYYQQNYL